MSNQREDDLCVPIYVPLPPLPPTEKNAEYVRTGGGAEQNGGSERHNIKSKYFLTAKAL